VQIKWGKQLELSELEFNRLRWRSRRGMLELDLLLLPFFDEVFAELKSDEQQAFIKLLEQDDPDLWDWFSRKSESDDPGLAALVERILDRVQP
jgi:antitoxin CptB